MRRTLFLALAIVAAGVLAYLWTGGTYALGSLSLVMVWAIAGMGMVIIIGNTGQLSLGHAAFMGIGAYSTAMFIEWLPGVYAGMLVGTLVGLAIAIVFALLIGLPALRLRGYYLAIATIAFGVGIEQAIRAMPFPNPVFGIPHILRDVPAGYMRDITTFFLIAAIFLVFFTIGRVILRSPFGVKFRMIRDSEVAARSFGTNLTRNKLQAFVISAIFCATAGSLFAVTQGVLQPRTFGLIAAIDLLLIVIIGGAIMLEGGLIGSFVIVGLPALVLEEIAPAGSLTLIYGVLLIIFVVALPSGIATGLVLLWHRKLQRPYMSALRYVHRRLPARGTSVTTSRGAHMFYTEKGAGPPLLYIHGNTGSHRWFREVMDMPGYRTVAPDMVNFGRSDRIERADSIDLYADHVAAFIEALDIEPCYTVGHSLGGGVAMSLAMRYPQKVRRLVLIDPAPIDGMDLDDDYYALIEAIKQSYVGIKRAVARAMGSRSGDRRLNGLLAREALLMNEEGFVKHAEAVASLDLRERARGFRIPALVVHGGMDPIVTEEQSRRTAQALGAEMKVFGDIGHALPIEDPERFKETVALFDGP